MNGSQSNDSTGNINRNHNTKGGDKKFAEYYQQNFSINNNSNVKSNNPESNSEGEYKDYIIDTPSRDLQNENEKLIMNLKIIDEFLNSKEMLEPNLSELDLVNLKLTNYLSQVNTISTSEYATKEQIQKALEIQVGILTNMVNITQLKMKQSSAVGSMNG